jgi:hypothetical protein
MDIYKCPKIKREKEDTENTTFSRVSDHNAVNFILN